jgi:hypothetical protein
MKLIYNISDSERRHHIVKKFFFGVLITERKKERLERYLERKKVQYEESRKIKFLRERERERECHFHNRLLLSRFKEEAWFSLSTQQ